MELILFESALKLMFYSVKLFDVSVKLLTASKNLVTSHIKSQPFKGRKKLD